MTNGENTPPRKGIILAGGTGSRLYPITTAISKQLLPVYDKPMIYYPLSTLMSAGIREVMIISTVQDTPRFTQVLGDGSQLGMRFHYAKQFAPEGIAQAFLIARDFIGTSSVALILGDNIFHGNSWTTLLHRANDRQGGATIFLSPVAQPQRYGVAVFDHESHLIDIVEKPEHPASRFAVTGLYFYDHSVCDIAANLLPSARGELEITDVNRVYLQIKMLRYVKMGRGMTWLDMGTPEALLDAAQNIEALERRQGLKIGCPEEIAFRNGWINADQLKETAAKMSNTEYGNYLLGLLKKP
jgi:glucose-1-phosphate thymidylyltransferase